MAHDGKPTRIAEHDEALRSLLDSLLAEVPREALPAAESAPSAGSVTEPATGPATRPAVPPLNEPGPTPLTRSEAPAWAVRGFQALLVRMGDARFAIPLLMMRSVAPLPGRCTAVPGQPDWHRGVVRYRERAVVMVELGPLIGVDVRCADPRYLIAIGDGGEALICDALDDAPVVAPGEVRWTASARAPTWFAGLLVAQMCVLLDAQAISASIRHR